MLKRQPTLIYEGCDKKQFAWKGGLWWPCTLSSATHASRKTAPNYLLPLLFHLSEVCHYPPLVLIHVLFLTAARLREQVRPRSVKSEASRQHMSGQTHSVITSGFNTCVQPAALWPRSMHNTARPEGPTTPPLTWAMTSWRVACVTGAPYNNCLLRTLFWMDLLLPAANRPGPSMEAHTEVLSAKDQLPASLQK